MRKENLSGAVRIVVALDNYFLGDVRLPRKELVKSPASCTLRFARARSTEVPAVQQNISFGQYEFVA